MIDLLFFKKKLKRLYTSLECLECIHKELNRELENTIELWDGLMDAVDRELEEMERLEEQKENPQYGNTITIQLPPANGQTTNQD